MAKSKSAKKVEERTPVLGNPKARHLYEIVETYECGIALRGGEVKSLREGRGSIEEAYARFRNAELWLVGMHVDEYRDRGSAVHEARRAKKLLLHRKEITELRLALDRQPYTLVPLRLYWTDRGFAKLELALAKGRKLHDKREVDKAKTARREMDRAMRRR